MNAQSSASLVTLAVLALTVGCTEPAGPDRHAARDLRPARDEVFLPNGGALQVHAAVKVEDVDDEHIRELVEITAFFAGLDPVDAEASTPTARDIQLDFRIDPAGDVVPCFLRIGIAGDAWTALDGGDFVVEVKDAQAVHDAVMVHVFESGQAVAELTGHIAGVEGHLKFLADEKVWQLKLDLTGIVTPSMIVTPTMFNPITGATGAVLQIGADQLATKIRENEAAHEGSFLATRAETRLREAGPGEIRELVAILARFPSGELQPDPQIGEVEDIQLDFDIHVAGVVGPPCIRILISGDAWVEGDGGGFKAEDTEPQWLQALVIREGQVVADLTDDINFAEATLNFLLSEKVWELRLEIAGIIIPTDVHVPLFSPIAGAGMVSLEIGAGLENLMATLREAEGIFGIVIPSD